MLVFAHVSSMNTRRLGSSCFWSSCQRVRSAAMSGRSCSAARTIFFKGDLLLGEESPNRAIAEADISRGKLAPYVMKRQIGRRRDGGEQPVSLVFETRIALPAHRLGRDAPGPPEPLRPPHDTAHADAEPLGRIPAACARHNSRHHARAKIFRIGLRHPSWPLPARILNHDKALLGIPPDSVTVHNALARY